ncbi:MAG: 2-C-methyl-D-erythritol 4-phosphate cytidylyltransferase [Clostridia bacterium]|nr:2-C-methyl-D-erythritol 4-phosphate cytidylyltransferase [Clostridia bacterium]
MKPSFDIAEILQKTIIGNHTAAVILAAGSSTRMGKGLNKQLQAVNGIPVLAHTLMAYQRCALIREIIVVARPQDFEAIYQISKTYHIKKLRHIVSGGATRQISAERGVAKVNEQTKYVAIADGARCLTTPEQIAKVCLRAYRHKAASAGHLISDTVKRATSLGAIKETVDRTGLWQVQTPQIFHTSLYAAALQRAKSEGYEVTDDNSLIEKLGYRIQLVECGRENLKITTKDDLALAEAILRYREATKE